MVRVLNKVLRMAESLFQFVGNESESFHVLYLKNIAKATVPDDGVEEQDYDEASVHEIMK